MHRIFSRRTRPQETDGRTYYYQLIITLNFFFFEASHTELITHQSLAWRHMVKTQIGPWGTSRPCNSATAQGPCIYQARQPVAPMYFRITASVLSWKAAPHASQHRNGWTRLRAPCSSSSIGHFRVHWFYKASYGSEDVRWCKVPAHTLSYLLKMLINVAILCILRNA